METLPLPVGMEPEGMQNNAMVATTNCATGFFEGSGFGGFSCEVSHANKHYPYIIHGLSTDYPRVIHAGHSGFSLGISQSF